MDNATFPEAVSSGFVCFRKSMHQSEFSKLEDLQILFHDLS